MWIDDDTRDRSLSAMWTLQESFEAPLQDSIKKLSGHAVFLALLTSGVRITSLLDSPSRTSSQPGRYLRWGNVEFTFLGWVEEKPRCLVTLTAQGTKRAWSLGDKQQTSVTFGTGTKKASHSVALAIIIIAILSGVLPGEFERVMTDASMARNRMNGGIKEIKFSVESKYKKCPVFIAQPRPSRVSRRPVRLREDDVTALGGKSEPMTTRQFRALTVAISRVISLNGRLGSAVLRRTFSMQAQAHKILAPHQIAINMGHFEGDVRLHQQVYVSTRLPQDAGTFASTAFTTTCEKEKEAISRVGSLESLPNRLSE